MTGWIRSALAGLMAVMLPQAALAVDAPENKIAHSIIIDAPTDRVWEMVGDFVGMDRWVPCA
jgi:uncharacterized membrane protein